jgi:hypothetical protein
LTTREIFSSGSVVQLQRRDYLVNRNVRAEGVDTLAKSYLVRGTML